MRREAQRDGIWAWDSEENAPVLLIPCVLALLGDNPMQSEFAAHIGLRGKYFCRACWVKGSDATADPDPDPRERGDARQSTGGTSGGESDGGSATGSEVDSEDALSSVDRRSRGPGQGRRRKVLETMSSMVSRVKAFVKVCGLANGVSDPSLTCMHWQVGEHRTKERTTGILRSMFDHASTLDTKTKVKDMRTSTGTKDTFQLHFLEKLFSSYSKKRGTDNKQAALNAELAKLPQNVTSPVWRIKGMPLPISPLILPDVDSKFV